MLLSDICKILDAKVLTGETMEQLNGIDIHMACGCDLMSDVLAFVKDQALLLSGLINSQVIRTAEMMDIIAVCFVRGKTPADDVIELAKDRGITLLATEHPLFRDMIGDYLAVAISDESIFNTHVEAALMPGGHAGLTKEELEIPLIVIEKE